MQPLIAAQPAPPACDAAAEPDLSDVRGQAHARRALEIAAAGEHSLVLIGPPGCGKSMLAQRLPGILPPMGDVEALETAALASLSRHGFRLEDWRRRPFRSPHHTVSAIALVGGGAYPRPGEVSLAHNGVLFLDELPEFDRAALEALREPVEAGRIVVSRAGRQAEFPARVQLVTAMNPCPCGHLGDALARCRCTPQRVASYRERISGPLLDRIDLHVEVPRVASDEIARGNPEESSAVVARRVAEARDRQHERQGCVNARLDGAAIDTRVRADPAALALLEAALQRLALSARAYHRVLRVARTIADIEGEACVHRQHVAEAVGLRRLDRRTDVAPAG